MIVFKWRDDSKEFILAEMVNMIKPDERAVMTYVSCYYHAFQGAQQVWHHWHAFNRCKPVYAFR